MPSGMSFLIQLISVQASMQSCQRATQAISQYSSLCAGQDMANCCTMDSFNAFSDYAAQCAQCPATGENPSNVIARMNQLCGGGSGIPFPPPDAVPCDNNGNQFPGPSNFPFPSQTPFPGQSNLPFPSQTPFPGQSNLPFPSQTPFPGQSNLPISSSTIGGFATYSPTPRANDASTPIVQGALFGLMFLL